MPRKYSIHGHTAPPRFPVIGQLGIVDWREDCSSCHNCVKRNCVYSLYRDENEILREENGYLDYIYGCKGCLVCVQNCTKNLLTRVVNPEYTRMGDGYFTPDIILSTWYQSETGSIPVSGSGYGGKFSGPGFDSMWTDMSEIVRPTRDGIHGREYINTSVDIGRKLARLSFTGGNLAVDPPLRIESPVPLMFNVIPDYLDRGPVLSALVKAAEAMDLYCVVLAERLRKEPALVSPRVVPMLENPGESAACSTAGMVILADSAEIVEECGAVKSHNSNQIAAVLVEAGPAASRRVSELAAAGVEVVYLRFNTNGLETASAAPRHMRDVLRDVHTTLVKAGLRDQITVIAASGIAMAEHMAKAIICGADLVAVDLPLLIALECRLCMECRRGEMCQVELEKIEPEYAVSRIINLIGAWRNQLLELLGAMGIREVRRLRGETGRCMFFEDLERESFGKLFGKRKTAQVQQAGVPGGEK